MALSADIREEIRGLKETQRNMEALAQDLHGEPIVEAMRDCTLIVERQAKLLAPVDTGRLRASITPQVTGRGMEVIGIVGSNVTYAPFMELGTRAHFPPWGALEVWAKRHHTSQFAVWRAIGLHGTKPRRFLQRAFEGSKDRIYARIDRAVKDTCNEHNHN